MAGTHTRYCREAPSLRCFIIKPSSWASAHFDLELEVHTGALMCELRPRHHCNGMASLNLLLKNEGDEPASPCQIHVLVTEDTSFELSPIPPVLEYEP